MTKAPKELTERILPFIGVVLGFVLGVAYGEWKTWRNERKIRRALRDELKANLYGLPQKRHILNQMLGALSKAELLSGESVPFSSKIYDAHFATVSAKLTVQERNSLHVIYTSLMMIDSTMKTATEKIMDKYDSEAFKDIVALEKGKLHDMKKVMDVTEQIIQKHLAGTPVDVMHLGSDYEKVKAQFGRH